MFILCVGISHQTAPVALREKLSIDESAAVQAMTGLAQRFDQSEIVILSTCNRTEFYIARPLHGHPRREELLRWLADRNCVNYAELDACSYHHESRRAVEHLFTVTAGLDSMVLGENQIAHQVKHAYELAQQANTCSRVLNRVFQSAMAAGKQVRTQTQIGKGRLSIASVAVDFAGRLFERFEDKTLLSIGAGKMAELAVKHFMDRKPGKLIVCNRTEETGRTLAQTFGGQVMPFDQLDDALTEADIVISFTGAREPIVTAGQFKTIHRRRHRRPLFMFDLSVPRDIDPAVGKVADVYLYDMDALGQVVAANQAMRQDEVDGAMEIVQKLVDECYTQVQMGDLGHLIKTLRNRLAEIGEAESKRIVDKLAAADPQQTHALLEEHTHRLINKILHAPLSRLSRESGTEAAMLATALRRLFELEPPEYRESPEPSCNLETDNAQGRPTGSTDVQ